MNKYNKFKGNKILSEEEIDINKIYGENKVI